MGLFFIFFAKYYDLVTTIPPISYYYEIAINPKGVVMEDKFAEDLALLVCLTKRIAIVACEMQKVCNDILENAQVKVSNISPEDYE